MEFSMSEKIKLTYGLETVGEYDTFPEAFTELHNRLKKDLEKGTSWQMVETTIWIEPPGWNEGPLSFYQSRDIACWMGLLVDGKINPNFKDPMK